MGQKGRNARRATLSVRQNQTKMGATWAQRSRVANGRAEVDSQLKTFDGSAWPGAESVEASHP
eukprot:3105249-Pleurochrysis_carterae.AAC.1